MKRHKCVAVVDETDETLERNQWVIISATYACCECGKPMDNPATVPRTITMALQLALGKL